MGAASVRLHVPHSLLCLQLSKSTRHIVCCSEIYFDSTVHGMPQVVDPSKLLTCADWCPE